jgi:hypothetical protein
VKIDKPEVKRGLEMFGGKRLPIRKAVDALERAIIDVPMGQPAFADNRYSPFKLSKDHFLPLPKRMPVRKIAFIDGGRAELVSAPNFSIGLNRVYFGLFQGDQRLEPTNIPSKIDFFTICYAAVSGKDITYKTELVPLEEDWNDLLPDKKDLQFNSFDRTLMTGYQRVSINRILDVARAFTEWRLNKYVIDLELDEGDVTVRDGTLQTFVTHESKYSNEAYKAALNKGVYFTAVSKTSTLFTDTGQPLFSSIRILSETSELKNQPWYYYPIVNINHPNHKAEMFAVKFHENSDHVFRFEILKDQVIKQNLGKVEFVLSALAANSRDIGFPGYPYGLVDADRFARVQMSEKNTREFQFRAVLSSQKSVWEKISKFMKSSDSHEILNKLIR